MIVITLSDLAPPKVRGDLSKWLIEINTGVYVGQGKCPCQGRTLETNL